MQPLAGRQIWLVGIGGAGLSAYGVLARAWGAEVGGWDRNETPYLAVVRAAGIKLVVSPEPELPQGWEIVVSSAYPTVAGQSRAEFLAELVSLRRSIVVAGTHGKSTTSAMIAFVLRELGRDPAFLVGAEAPQLDGNVGTGEGWLVVEGDESDRTVELLRPDIGVVTNVELDHHVTFVSEAEIAELFERWLGDVRVAVRGSELEPLPADALPHLAGEHNRRNGAAALAALELAGENRAEAARALREFRGVGRRFELVGEERGVAVYDDYAHHPTELAATLAAARERGDRVHVLFQPHLPSRTRHLARELGSALAEADSACVSEIYAAREEVPPGVSGKAVVDALAEARPGMPIGWAPDPADGARVVAEWASAGDVVLVVGAGDVDRAAPLVLEALR
ncbi:MAG TPA: cyanophycin synthetase [Gaiellaceae bacterium]|nr:cyanophycin synthetase [Gaiellaceae bacterium]